MFECDISHCRFVAVLCMIYNIRCNAVHPLNGAPPGPYVPERVTRSVLGAHRYTYAPPRCRTLQYSRTFIPFSVSLWNDLASPIFDGVRLVGFKSIANASLFAYAARSIPTIVSYFFSFLFLLSIGWYYGAGVFGLIGCTSLSLSLDCRPFLIIIIICATFHTCPHLWHRFYFLYLVSAQFPLLFPFPHQ